MKEPIVQMLQNQKDRCSFHMPGHHGFAPGGMWQEVYALDTTEVMNTDHLYEPKGGILQGQRLMAKAAKAAGTLLLTGGSTAGILAMILYTLRPGKKIILPRGAHHSVIHGCILAGAEPVYVYPRRTCDNYYYYTQEDYVSVMKECPKAKGVFITRPDYYGHMINLDEIILLAKKQGQLVLVDEAHGAHLNWQEPIKGASANGADIWVQSAHKTLPVLTGGAWLHYGHNIDGDALTQCLQMVQTSSPSFIIMASLDRGRAWMEEKGEEALGELKVQIEGFFTNLKQTPYKNAFALWKKEGLIFDPFKMVITAPQGGFTLLEQLYHQGIDVEMADDERIVCMPSVMTPAVTFKKLLTALKETKPGSSRKAARTPAILFEKNRVQMDIRSAALGPKKWVNLSQIKGRICASAVGAYPPGIPWLLPGEEVSENMAQRLLHLKEENAFGIKNGSISCVQE